MRQHNKAPCTEFGTQQILKNAINGNSNSEERKAHDGACISQQELK